MLLLYALPSIPACNPGDIYPKTESVIFRNDDVADLDDEELFRLVESNCIMTHDRYTVSRSGSGFVSVNINFVEYEDMIGN